MRFLNIAASVVAISTLTAAWKCELEDTRYLGQNATLIQAVDVLPEDPTVNLTISGTMRVVDACSFAIDNFVFIHGSNETTTGVNETFWYGLRDETYNKGKISNDTVMITNGTTATFSFVDFPIARGWDDIDTLVLFSENSMTALAFARLNLTEIRKIRNTTTDGETTTDNNTDTPANNGTATSGSRQQFVKGSPYYSVAMFVCTLALGLSFVF